ncbi:hypothetical protein [Calidifontibacillus oryziterrae]|uniref:hypothetical protein n=1 Tax=Calidifontibacillus oryziterrae TaxID=1191699 RepID=UPI0003810EEA|nr:hypothetical protein [Calidifontibacillus oryziterrae]
MHSSYRQQQIIGTAWVGRHVVILRCNTYRNQLLSLEKSFVAPLEPAHPNCAETLSRFLSIGYEIYHTIMISATEIQYILIKNNH